MKSSITETYKLPSLGKLNGINPEVTLRSMTTFEEKMRLGAKGRFFRNISEIINSCMVGDNKFDSYMLTLPDFIFLFYQLRIVSYGKDYTVSTYCSECKEKFTHKVDLSTLSVKELPDDFVEPINLTLPRSGDKISIRMLRTHEVDEIAKEAEIIKKNNPNYVGDPSYLLSLSRKIVEINGKEPDSIVIDKFVQDMEALDANYIDYKYNKIDFGLDLTVKCKCPHCGEDIEFALPVGGNFFRPEFDD